MSSKNLTLFSGKKFGGSLTDLNKPTTNCEPNREFKEKSDLLRRAFSSKYRQKVKLRNDTEVFQGQALRLSCNRLHSVTSNQCQNSPKSLQSSLETLLHSHSHSPATDLVSRRSVFSRKHYGSIEMLSNYDSEGFTNNAGRFRMETGCGERDSDQTVRLTSAPLHLENPEAQTRWYFKYFLGKVHQVYAGTDLDKEPFLLAMVVTDAANHGVNQYRAILWRKLGSQKLCLPFHNGNPLSVKKILSCFDVHRFDRSAKEIFNPKIQKDALILEEQEGSVNFKFGVLYAKEGQCSDEEMYNNEHGSEEFDNFIDLLGERVALKDWDKFKAGLDTKNAATGKESVYTVYEGHEIMFHISTLLPYSVDNRQQVERKRHVGNDIVNIIFIDQSDSSKPCSWRPAMMKTHFTHIFAIVTYDTNTQCYRLNISAEESVPLFGPPLPTPPEFSDKEQFRDFLLVKLINGEKAAFHSPVFAQKRQRTLDMLLRNILDNYVNDGNKMNVMSRRAFSDIVSDQLNGISTRKEESRGLEFMRIGQSLKLKTILRGDAPTSLITSGLSKKEPWQPYLFFPDLFYEVVCGESWNDRIVACTEEGTFLLQEGTAMHQIMDRSIAVKQISIVETLGIMILRIDKGKEGRICVFQLHDVNALVEDCPLSKSCIRHQKIDKTKACHLFALSKSYMNPLRMIVAVGRKLQVFAWKLLTASSSLSSWNQFKESQIESGFQFIRDLSTFEPAQIMTLIDGCRGAHRICIGYRNQFDLIDERTGDTIRLFRHDSLKAQVVAAIDVYADDEAELLLGINRTCYFQKLYKDQSIVNTLSNNCESTLINDACFSSAASNTTSNGLGEFDFCWNFEPSEIVIAFPYVLGFAQNAIEVRLIINGNLVHTMNVPDCRLISSKFDIYFMASVATLSQETTAIRVSSPPALQISPNSHSPATLQSDVMTNDEGILSRNRSFYVYKIPLSCLTGGHSTPIVINNTNNTCEMSTSFVSANSCDCNIPSSP